MSNEKLIEDLYTTTFSNNEAFFKRAADALAQADKDTKTLQLMLNIETAANNKALIDIEEKDKEIESLRKDAARMSYVCSVTRCDPKMDGNHVFFGIGGRPLKGGSLRQAIDSELVRMYGSVEAYAAIAAMPEGE